VGALHDASVNRVPAPRAGPRGSKGLAKESNESLPTGPRRRVYDLRHTFASEALAAGVSLYELSRFMGASVRVLEMHYAHLVDSAEDAARVKLDARAAAV
jgi:integrase